MIRYILVPLFAVLFLPSALADTEFEDSVPLELVKALIGNTPYGESRIFSDLSSEFPRVDIPDALELMGSIERGFGVAAVFSTELSASATESALHDAFIQSEYMEFEVLAMEGLQNGFVSPLGNRPIRYSRYCHDSFGFLSHTYSPKDQKGIVTVSANFANDNRSCADQLAEQQQAMERRSPNGLSHYLPTMELPVTEAPRSRPFLGSGGWSGSSNSIETDASVRIDWSIEEVFSHFTRQIEAQQWSSDSQNIGASSAIGIWVRSPEVGVDLIGTLTILKAGDESFELKFQLSSIGGANDSSPRVFRSN